MAAIWILAAFSLTFLTISLIHFRSIKQFSVFALDRGAFGTFTLYATILASGIGAGNIMGIAEKAYTSGCFYTLASLGFVAQLLLSAWLAPRVYQWRHCLSSGEVIGKGYGSLRVQCLSGLIWVAFCIGIISAQVVAMVRVASLLLPRWQVEIGFFLSGIVIVYSCLGGVRSVVRTDVIQAILLFSALVFLILWGIEATGGKEILIKTIHEDIASIPERFSLLKLLFLFIWFFLGDALIPVSVQRIAMARTCCQARLALLVTALGVLFVITMAGGIGHIASLLDSGQPAENTFLILVENIPEPLKVLMLIGLLAAVMSSCDSYLNTAAVACVNDVLATRSHCLNETQKLWAGRWCTLLIGFLAILIAYGTNDILNILLACYELWGPTLLPQLLVILFCRKLPVTFFYLPFFTGVSTLLIWKTLVSDQTWLSAALTVSILVNGSTLLILFFLGMRKR